MAGQTHAIDIGDDDLLPPWMTVFEVDRAIDVSDWVLVGGLMVQLHARRASIPPPRATKDVDLIADVQTNRSSFGSIGSALTSIGFAVTVPDARTEPIYRFTRGEEQVDVMVADHLPARVRCGRRRPGTQSSRHICRQLDERDDHDRCSRRARGANRKRRGLHGRSARSRRHVEDAAVLLASIESIGDLDLGLNSHDRKRLRALATDLQDGLHSAWLVLDEGARRRGQRNLDLLVSEARLSAR